MISNVPEKNRFAYSQNNSKNIPVTLSFEFDKGDDYVENLSVFKKLCLDAVNEINKEIAHAPAKKPKV
jgi:hypothetical protein